MNLEDRGFRREASPSDVADTINGKRPLFGLVPFLEC
jgi:hypothetical protein